VPEFLDLTHRYALLAAEDDEGRERINRVLLGPPRLGGGKTSPVDEQAGFVPPAWWKGDEYASRSSVAAMMTLKR
jgi:hypothetical protein